MSILIFNKRYYLVLPVYVLFLIFCSSCSEQPQPSNSTRHLGMMSDSLVNYNRSIVRTEDQQIEDFIAREEIEMIVYLTSVLEDE